MACTRLDIAYKDVGMLDKFDRGLQTYVQVFVNFNYAMGRSITVMGRSIISGVYDTYGGCKGGYLAKWTSNRVRIRAKDSAGIATGALSKAIPGLRFQHRLNLLSIESSDDAFESDPEFDLFGVEFSDPACEVDRVSFVAFSTKISSYSSSILSCEFDISISLSYFQLDDSSNTTFLLTIIFS
ncbi:hypothetical protein Tco_0180598 [Tanacetum coccineum]